MKMVSSAIVLAALVFPLATEASSRLRASDSKAAKTTATGPFEEFLKEGAVPKGAPSGFRDWVSRPAVRLEQRACDVLNEAFLDWKISVTLTPGQESGEQEAKQKVKVTLAWAFKELKEKYAEVKVQFLYFERFSSLALPTCGSSTWKDIEEDSLTLGEDVYVGDVYVRKRRAWLCGGDELEKLKLDVFCPYATDIVNVVVAKEKVPTSLGEKKPNDQVSRWLLTLKTFEGDARNSIVKEEQEVRSALVKRVAATTGTESFINKAEDLQRSDIETHAFGHLRALQAMCDSGPVNFGKVERSQPPANFRQFAVSIGEHKGIIAGLANPVRYNCREEDGDGEETRTDEKVVFQQLANAGFKTVIGMDASENSENKLVDAALSVGIRYRLVTVGDLMRPTDDAIEEISNIVTTCFQKSERVALHCGEGYGRTGMILSALLIRGKSFPVWSSGNSTPIENKMVRLGHYGGDGVVPATEMVKTVVTFLRSVEEEQRPWKHNQGTEGMSVEGQKQVKYLNEVSRQAHP